MKRLVCLICAFLMVLSVSGCKKDEKKKESVKKGTSESSVQSDTESSKEESVSSGNTVTEESKPVSSPTASPSQNPSQKPPQKPQQNPSQNPSQGGNKPMQGKETYKYIFETETKWLSDMQLSNGALPMTPASEGAVTVNPYFADFAALALLDAADKYAGNVKRYCEWHFSHLNTAAQDINGVDGTIYDYTASVAGGKVIGERINLSDNGKKHYDSTDSYAATFLSVLNKYLVKTGDKQFIAAHKNEIKRIVNAMHSTYDNGLTSAKPDYEVKYLMDNCEVYEGAKDAANLIRQAIITGDPSFKTVADQCEATSKSIKNKILTLLWNEKEQRFEPGVFKDEKVAFKFDWNQYYPCASGQVFPVLSGVISADDSKAKTVYNEYCKRFKWEEFKGTGTFYWGSNAQAAAIMGDAERVNTYFKKYKIIMKNHAYPLYNADAARVSMAAYIMLQK